MRRWLSKSIALVPWRWRGAIKRIPLVSALQRWLLANYLEGGEFVHTVDAGPARGLRYPINLPEDKGIWTGTYELEFAERLSSAVEPGNVCFDIGGWRGFYGGVMALAGAKQVFIFEPLPANCAHIRDLIALNGALPLKLVEAAVGEATGKIEFEVMPQSSMGKLATSPFQQEHHSAKRIQVDLLALDDLLAPGKIQPPSVIKMDIEGAEVFALRGARRILSTHHPKLFIEIHSRALARECACLLEGHGYSIEVFETGLKPDFATEPEVCHFAALHEGAEHKSRPARKRKKLNNTDVPILLYHHLVPHDDANPEWYEISVRQFERQLDLIRRLGFTPVNLGTLFGMLEEGEALPVRPIVITFDDGYRSFLELALPALKRREMKATVFVPVGHIGGTNEWDREHGIPERAIMDANELRQIAKAGMEIGSHGWMHRSLTDCAEPEAYEEAVRSRERLRQLGFSADVFAYPYGHYSARSCQILKDAGYRAAVSIFSNEPSVTANRFAVRRIHIHPGDRWPRFWLKLSPFYLRYAAWRDQSTTSRA